MTAFITEHLHQLLGMGILLALSALFSGSETALFSLRAADLNQLRRRASSTDRMSLALHKDLQGVLLTILLGNMIVNILFFATSAVFTAEITKCFGRGAAAAFSLLSLLTIIIFGEVTPKSVASATRIPFCRLISLPMYMLHRAIWPVRLVLKRFVRVAERIANTGDHVHNKSEDLKLLLELGRSNGIVSRDEHSLIGTVIDFPEIRVSEMMTPRIDLMTIPENTPAQDILDFAKSCGHSKLPVRSNMDDELIGWVDAREIFFSEELEKNFLRKPLYLSEFDRADHALKLFAKTKIPLALVVDERGYSAGMLTLSDIVSELFGEFGGLDGAPEEPIRKEGSDSYIIDGRVSVREWNEVLGTNLDFPGVCSMGGLATALLGRTAKKGDIIKTANLILEVVSVIKRRPEKLRVYPNTEEAE